MLQVSYLLKTGTLIIGDGRLLNDVSVLVRDGRIAEIGESIKPHDKCETLDFSDRVVMPGLIDAHVHVCYDGFTLDPSALRDLSDEFLAIRGSRLAATLLDHGVTTAADAGSRGNVSLAVREAIQKGIVKGPRLLVCGRMITITGGRDPISGANEADGVEGVRKATREELARGVDFIKLAGTGAITSQHTESMTTQFNEDELRVATQEAHKVERKTHSHAYGAQGIRDTVMAGVDVLVHGHPLTSENIDLMKQMNTMYMPTIVTYYESQLHHDEGKLPEYMIRKEKEIFPLIERGVQDAVRAGIPLVAGTDSGMPYTIFGKSSAEELELFVEMGKMSAMDAITAGTFNAAKALNIENHVGAIKLGMSADLLVLAPGKNPLEDITVLQDREAIERIFLMGEIVERN
ncbi:MAG: amidohydrolase family protein [Candidatus Thorarchaeota archaeon]